MTPPAVGHDDAGRGAGEREKGAQLPPGWRGWLGATLLAYAAILVCTRPVAYVDSLNYAFQMVQHWHGSAPAGQDHVWDFGHAVWRPLGLAVWWVLRPLFDRWYPAEEALSAACALIFINMVAGAANAVLLFRVAARETGKAWAGAATAVGYSSTAMAMNYMATGTAYLTGSALQLGALGVLCLALRQDRLEWRRAAAAGVLLGFSICIWFPFVLSLPAFLLLPLVWPAPRNAIGAGERVRFTAEMGLTIAAAVVACYTVVIAAAHIGSMADLRAWAAQSRYGIAPSEGFTRMLAGIPRSFLWLGDDATNWKRMLKGGSAASIFTAPGIWRFWVVYLALAAVTAQLAKDKRGRALLACLAAAGVPVVIFAALLFDASALERYIQVYPMLFLGFACVLASGRASWAARVVVAGFFLCMLASNGIAFSRWQGNRGWEKAVARLESLGRTAGPADRILIVSFQDDLYKFVKARPFDPASRLRDNLYVVVSQGAEQAGFWQKIVAEEALRAWDQGGRVFLSVRMLAAEPAAEWNWVEGDDPRVRWASIPAFFHRLDVEQPFGGTDGFAILARTPRNEGLLRAARDSEAAGRQ